MSMVPSMESELNLDLLDTAARADANEGIRQGLEDAKNGRLRPVGEFFAEFETSHPEIVSKRRNLHPA